MTRRRTIITGTGGVLVVVLVAAVLFVRYQIRKSFPVTEGSVALSGIHEGIDIVRDSFGVPHIVAKSEHDLMFGLGYAHAQDRLWQMDVERRAGQGRLSELFGKVTVPYDRMFRIVGIERTARAIVDRMTPGSRRRLEAYADGVNAFLATHRGKYPLEFDLLRYDPDPWTPLHSVILARLMAWELNLSWWTDLTMGAIAERVGPQKMLDIMPTFPADVAPSVPDVQWRKFVSLGTGYRSIARSFAGFLGTASVSGGSNAWVVAPSRSASGKVILANDTHLQLSLPSRWYEVLLRAPGYNVRGMSVPGIPGVVAGRNDSIAWGMTNVMADDADFYVEKIDSTNQERYLYNGSWRPLVIIDDTIQVRGDSVVPLRIRLTHHGPIVSDIVTPLQKAHYPYVASMRWTGFEIDDQIEAFNRIDRAENWGQFTAGVREFAVPGQNFVYGDVRGNIGYWCGVRLPIRGRQSSLFPLPGWDISAEWKGFVPFHQLPHLYNPPEGYIATANNKIVDDSYPYYISDLWEPPSRIVRLREVLGKKGELFAVADFERLQNDQFSHFAKEMVPYIMAVFRDSTQNTPEEQQTLEYLRNWNFVFTREDIATSIFQQFFVRLLENIYKDEMGDDLFHDFVVLGNIPIRVTARLMQEGTSVWFDDVTTEVIETRDIIIRKSLRQALDMLRRQSGNDMRKWRWGDLHTVTLRHPFGLQKPLGAIFNLGPYPFGGGSTTLISGEYSYTQPFTVTVGPSFRQIFDMANTLEVRSVLPSGQSGQVFNRCYDDQTKLWLNGGYRIARSDEQGRGWHRLRLEPPP